MDTLWEESAKFVKSLQSYRDYEFVCENNVTTTQVGNMNTYKSVSKRWQKLLLLIQNGFDNDSKVDPDNL